MQARIFNLALFALLLTAGCASQPPSPELVSALQAEFASARVVADTDCIFSGPVKNEFRAYRHFGLCLYSDTQLRLYYGGTQPKLAYSWPIGAIKAYALHRSIFTLVTDAGNFGMVVDNAPGFVAALRARGVRENAKLPEFSSKDPAPWNWFWW